MVLRHRVVQRFDRGSRNADVVQEIVRSALNEWLAKRGGRISSDLRGAPRLVGGGYTAGFQRISVKGLGEVLRWRVIVGSPPHLYRSTITVLVAEGVHEASWIWYDVETDRDNSRFSPPLLTSLLTSALGATPRDRISGFTEGLRKVQADEVGEFIDMVLNDERRVVPAFVSGGRSWSLQEEEHVERALAPLHGIGTFWQLAHDAFDEFNSLVKTGYSVYSGSIHSFQFGLDTEDEQDSRRHWWFSPAEVRQSNAWDLSKRLHVEAMQSGLQVPLPEQLVGLSQLFDKQESRRLFGQLSVAQASRNEKSDAPVRLDPASFQDLRQLQEQPKVDYASLVEIPQKEKQQSDVISIGTQSESYSNAVPNVRAPADDEAGLIRLVEGVVDEFELNVPRNGSLLGRLNAMLVGIREKVRSSIRIVATDQETLTEIQSQFEELQQDRLELQDEVEVLRGVIGLADEEAEVQSDILESQRRIAADEQKRADHLASELARLQQATGGSVAWDVPGASSKATAPSPAPTTVDDLFKQISLLNHVVFSGDRKEASRITDLKLRGIILRDVWRFFCELERYASAEAPDKAPNLREYVDRFTTQIAQGEFAADETKSVKENPKFRAPRTLPVPTSVDPSGRAFMGAHFRLSQDNGKAMRMHVLDATAIDGKVYVGYIGQHLPSRMSS
ncbi:hypothetical protein [Leucobacter sp. GX0328]